MDLVALIRTVTLSRPLLNRLSPDDLANVMSISEEVHEAIEYAKLKYSRPVTFYLYDRIRCNDVANAQLCDEAFIRGTITLENLVLNFNNSPIRHDGRDTEHLVDMLKNSPKEVARTVKRVEVNSFELRDGQPAIYLARLGVEFSSCKSLKITGSVFGGCVQFFPKLERLTLMEASLQEIADLTHPEKVTYLSLAKIPVISHFCANALRRFSNVDTLAVTSMIDIAPLAGIVDYWSELRRVKLTLDKNIGCDETLLPALARSCPKLSRLELRHFVSRATPAFDANFEALTHLSLSGCLDGSTVSNIFRRFPALQVLHLEIAHFSFSLNQLSAIREHLMRLSSNEKETCLPAACKIFFSVVLCAPDKTSLENHSSLSQLVSVLQCLLHRFGNRWLQVALAMERFVFPRKDLCCPILAPFLHSLAIYAQLASLKLDYDMAKYVLVEGPLKEQLPKMASLKLISFEPIDTFETQHVRSLMDVALQHADLFVPYSRKMLGKEFLARNVDWHHPSQKRGFYMRRSTTSTQ